MNDALIWVPLAVIGALTMAGMVLISEFHKVATMPRLFWLRLMTLAAMATTWGFIDWPDQPLFYICMLSLTMLICISDILYYGSARDNGAGPTSRIEPLSVLLTFVAWSVIVPAQLEDYAASPWVTAGICACFVTAGYCAMQLRHSPVSAATFKKLLPVIAIMAAVNILGKTGMDAGGDPLHAAVAYLSIQAGMLSVFYGAFCLLWPQRNGSLRPTKLLIVSAAMMAVCSILHVIPKNMAYTFVSNPAYVVVIGLTAPLFVAAFYRMRGRRDDAQVWAGFGIVASAAILVVLTQF